jgi:hypothetical protein
MSRALVVLSIIINVLSFMLVAAPLTGASTITVQDGTVTANRQDSATGTTQWFGEAVTTATTDAQNLDAGQHVEVSGTITGISDPDTSWVEIGLITKARWDYWQTAYSGNYKAAVFDKGLYVVHWSGSGLGLSLQEGWDDWTANTSTNSGPYAWPLESPTAADPWDFSIRMYPTTDNDGNSYLSVTGEVDEDYWDSGRGDPALYIYGSQPFVYGQNDEDYDECYLFEWIDLD